MTVAALACAFLFSGALIYAKKPAAVGNKSLDLDALASSLKAKSKERTIPSEDLPAIPSFVSGYEHPAAVELPGKRGVIQQLIKCLDQQCRPRIKRLIVDGERLEPQASFDLPPLPKGFTKFEFLPLAMLDVDGDGKDELLVRYHMEGVRRPDGVLTNLDLLAIMTLPEMTMSLFHELASSGREGVDPVCKYSIARLHLDADKRFDLQFVRACVCEKDTDACQTNTLAPEDYLSLPDRRFERHFQKL